MNSYSKGVSDALGIQEANVGTHAMFFYPPDLKNGFGKHWLERKLSTDDVATLLNIDRATVCDWRRRGYLNGNKTGTRKGWRKIVFWRHSLQDIDACLQRVTPKHKLDNPVADKAWTPQEVELLQHGIRPEFRSAQACRIKKCRLRKEGTL